MLPARRRTLARMPDSPSSADRAIGEELAEWGTVLLLETRGRRSGDPVTTAVGYVEQPDGSLLIAANDETSHWARNLLAAPACRVTREGRTAIYVAEPLEGDRRNAAVVDLILRYGTPAERLGAGPVFRLVPAAAGPASSD
jgi:deazaflavin-dependent oxidoreductase (nitroreductase family)